jgi:hypothetical protein
MNKTCLAKAMLWFLVVIPSAFGIMLLLAVFALPQELVSQYIYAFSLPGMAWVFGLAGVLFLAIGIGSWKFREKAQSEIENTFAYSCRDLGQLADTIGRLFLDDRVCFHALLGIILLSIVGRLVFLFQPIRYDEAFTLIEFAAESFSAVISDYHVPNNHVFHTVLVFICYRLFGDQPWIIRLPAFFSGVVLVPVSFLLGQVLYNRPTGLLTASLVATSPLLIDYSTNARGYMLVTLLFVLLLFLSAYVRRQQNRVAWLQISILASLGFWTIPVMLYPFGVVMLWLLFSNLAGDADLPRRTTIIRRVIISAIFTSLLTVLLYLPVFLNSGVGSVIANPFVSPVSWTEFLTDLPPSLLSTWKLWTVSLPSFLVVVLILGTVISVLFHHRLASHRMPILFAVIVWCPLILILSRAVPPTRVWLFLLPLFLVFASSGLVFLFQHIGISKQSRAFAIATLAITLFLLANLVLSRLSTMGTPGRVERLAAFLEDYLEPSDRVLTSCCLDYELLYYFRQNDIPDEYLLDREHLGERVLILVDERRAQTPEEVLRTTGLFGKVSLTSPAVVQEFDGAILYETGSAAKRQ